ncbi:hypothetical protein EVAR_45701_1 [Eumeta japonica]|uniref:Uncharacterized protein n=1 Tax=Eumeta variegata TaxID=151549 RepID=A0A4C1WZ57_EUMVA|nr:hypothetical protein EVAR_45701_1 [Eumeta japonica]
MDTCNRKGVTSALSVSLGRNWICDGRGVFTKDIVEYSNTSRVGLLISEGLSLTITSYTKHKRYGAHAVQLRSALDHSLFFRPCDADDRAQHVPLPGTAPPM